MIYLFGIACPSARIYSLQPIVSLHEKTLDKMYTDCLFSRGSKTLTKRPSHPTPNSAAF